MKVSCDRHALATAFQVVGAVVPSRTPKDILKNVKLHVADGQATLIGTDQEVGVRYELPQVETESAGELLLPAGRVTTMLRELRDERVVIEATEESVWVRTGHSEFQLSAENPSEFPDVAPFDEEQYYVLDAGRLRDGIRRTIFAVDVESTRYALGGILLDFKGDSVNLVATDSRRLALVKVSCSAHGVDEPPATGPVVPRTAMSLIERSVGEDEPEVYIAVHPNDVLIKCGHSTIYSRLVEGRFPRYEAVIPERAEVQVDLVAGPFYSAIRQSQIVTDDESRGVDFVFSNGLLTLKSRSPSVGTSRVELPISWEREDLAITFDPRFLADFLRILDPEQSIRLDLIDGESAAVLRLDDGYTYVIMPLSRER